MSKRKENILIIGAGLVGSLLSVLLAKKGYEVTVLEKRPDIRTDFYAGGRSINLALSNRGWKALEMIDMDREVRDISIPMSGRMIHDENSVLSYQPYGRRDQCIYSVSRGELNRILIECAGKYGVNLHFNMHCGNIDFERSLVEVVDNSTGKEVVYTASIIAGADGSFSVVRDQMMKSGRHNYQQSYLEHGYKELTIPPDTKGAYALENNVLHIWPRGKFMFIALPNLDKSFTCTLFLPFEGQNSFDSLNDEKKVKAFFKETFADAYKVMPTLTRDFFYNPTSSLVTINFFPWVNRNTFLIGDACHAIVPFYGQGMNAGFEDCTILNKILMENPGNWLETLQRFQYSRKPDTDAIADLAIQNFVEMRDKVADSKFLLRKKIESELYELFPDNWVPLYSQVTFSNAGYAQALRKGRLQDEIMDGIMNQEGIENNWQNLNFQKIIDDYNKLIQDDSV